MKKPEIEVVFAPGCFDGFDGTPEELQELMAEIRQKAADGTLFEQARPVTDEEWEQIEMQQKGTRH